MNTQHDAETESLVYDDVVRIMDQPSLSATVHEGNSGFTNQRASLADVARLAEVSPITVSRALRNPARVRPDKRKRIQLAVEQTGYSINPYASALKSGRSNIVLAFASNTMSEQFSLALKACAEVLEKAGFLFLVGQTSYSYERETAAIRSLHAMKPAAVMFTGVIELQANREVLRSLEIPIMETWAFPKDPIDMLVGFSNTEAGQLAAELLSRKGYREVAYIGRRSGRGALRLKGFRTQCQLLGMDLVSEVLVDDITGLSKGRSCLHEILKSAVNPQAVFCANDVLALGCLMEARRLGISVPKDLGIIGFGDSDIAAEIPPGLTTIGVDSARLGNEAGKMLIARLSGEIIDEKTRRLDLIVSERGSI
ncbi:substrate-binding domain-containing protein [Oryzifoliimicrobium ureilyticus]|uniref:substrate-binding domain-containing protein n=1 Tax=Oryzifoliimicrobium ureilyticus TaxID=3113724 RepID=UPI0030760339